MKVKLILILLVLLMSTASHGTAQMVFNLDFDQDGALEIFYPLQTDETVALDIYVSNIISPGLRTMGFVLTYDDSHLQLVAGSAAVDAVNWPFNAANDLGGGQADFFGGRILLPGIAGDDIKLAQVTFRALQTGVSLLKLYDRDRGGSVLDFVLANDVALDDEIAGGVHLARIHAGCPADINADGDVDGVELSKLVAEFGQPDCVGCESDYDGNDAVDQADLALLALEFGSDTCFE